MNPLKNAWNTVKKPSNNGIPIDITTTQIPDAFYGSFAPYAANQFGYELNWRIAYIRTWAAAGVFNNRPALSAANTMNANGKTTAQLFRIAYDKIDQLHLQAEILNDHAVNCLGSI